jgi:hypothetical protein
MDIDTPFGCVIQLGVLSMNMMSPGHRVPETLLNVSLRFVLLSEINGRNRYGLVFSVTLGTVCK